MEKKGSLPQTDKDERNNLLFTRGSESAVPLMFLIFVIASDLYRLPETPDMSPNIKADVAIILVKLRQSHSSW